MKEHQSGKRIAGQEGVEKVDGDKLLKKLEIRKLSMNYARQVLSLDSESLQT